MNIDNQKENVSPDLIQSTRDLIQSTKDTRPTSTKYIEISLPESTKTVEMKYKGGKPDRNRLLGETVLARGGEAFQNLRGDSKLQKERLGAGNEEKKKRKFNVQSDMGCLMVGTVPRDREAYQAREAFQRHETCGSVKADGDGDGGGGDVENEVFLDLGSVDSGGEIGGGDDDDGQEYSGGAGDGKNVRDRAGDGRSVQCRADDSKSVRDRTGTGILCGNLGTKGVRVNNIMSNVYIRSMPTARTVSRTSSRTGPSESRRTRPGSSGETGCSPLRRTSRSDRKTSSRRTSTLSMGRGTSKTTSTSKMATVSSQGVKDLVQIYHGLGGNQTNGLMRSQSASSHCGIGQEHSVDSQPGPDRETGEHLIGCEKDGES